MPNLQFQIIKNRLTGIVIILLLIFGMLAIEVSHPQFIRIMGVASFYLSALLLVFLVYKSLAILASKEQEERDGASSERIKKTNTEDTQHAQDA